MFSLLLGMGVTFGMGAAVDYFAERGQVQISFVVCAGVIFVLMVLHSITMLLTVEKEQHEIQSKTLIASLKMLLKNKKILAVTVVFVHFVIKKQ